MNWWAKLKLRWRLAMHGEDAILNAIDAIHAAGHQLGTDGIELVDAEGALHFHRIAIAHLTQLIEYEAEPEPIYPDEHEANGLLHVVPKDLRQQEIA